MVLVSTLGLGVFSVLLGRKNRDLVAANAKETAARQLADANAEVAREQTEVAVDLANTVIFDVAQGTRHLPGSVVLRKRVLATVLEKMPHINREFSDNDRLERDRLVALYEMGDAVHPIGRPR